MHETLLKGESGNGGNNPSGSIPAEDFFEQSGLKLNRGASPTSPVDIVIDGKGKREITLGEAADFPIITVGNGVTLTLRGITFTGFSGNHAPLIRVEGGGKLILETGAVITGNVHMGGNGGGVYVDNGAFIMNDGTISGNTALSGGGVYGTGAASSFVKAGGIIYGANGGSNANSALTGPAVFWTNGSRQRSTTAGPTVPMDSEKSGASGGWE
jgi:hypothetical protein